MKRSNHKPIPVNVGTVGHVDYGKKQNYKQYTQKNHKQRFWDKIPGFLSKLVSRTARVTDVFNNLLNRPVKKAEQLDKPVFWWDRIVEPPKIRLTRRHGFRQSTGVYSEIEGVKKRHRKAKKRINDIWCCIRNNPCLSQPLKNLYFV